MPISPRWIRWANFRRARRWPCWDRGTGHQVLLCEVERVADEDDFFGSHGLGLRRCRDAGTAVATYATRSLIHEVAGENWRHSTDALAGEALRRGAEQRRDTQTKGLPAT
jgi:hypothetical protein